ncbi:MAG: hypothetical protein FWE23_10145 [Chitinivibrionia bacterium]|nr:hypothetical protein [Chitinivibrionia bacterium]
MLILQIILVLAAIIVLFVIFLPNKIELRFSNNFLEFRYKNPFFSYAFKPKDVSDALGDHNLEEDDFDKK